MNLGEINNIFDIDKDVMKKIDEFKDDRISKAISDTNDKYCVVFHAIPIDAFSRLPIIMSNVDKELLKSSFFQGRYSYNFEGLYNNDSEYEFYQIFRNGVFEVKLEQYGSEPSISVQYYKKKYVDFVKDSLNIYNSIGIGSPILFYVSILNIRGYILDEGPRVRSNVRDIERNILDPIGYIIGNECNIENEVGKLFVPIWNHFGIYDDYIHYQEE